MTGIPHHNHPAFTDAAATLRAHGYHVVSPHELGPIPGGGWVDHLRRDLLILITADPDGLAALPDGPDLPGDYPPSTGRATEINTAKALGIPVLPVSGWLGTP